jgi:hypothetical protein
MKFPLLLLCVVLAGASAQAQTKTSYSGNVLDAFDKKYLEGVTVAVVGKESVKTNPRGYFSVEGIMGDTLVLSFPGFIDQKVVLGQDRFLLLQIQDRARLLPTFQVEAEPYRFRFKDGKLYLADDEPEAEKSLSQKMSAGFGTSDGGGGVAIYGPISYFTRRNVQLRKYEARLEWIKRRQGYLEVIDSDSIRTELMAKYRLDRSAWDEMIIRFNEFHLNHEFLDWSKERVISNLTDFLRIESLLED